MRNKLVSAAVVALVVLAVLAWRSSFLWFPGVTPKQTAGILIQDAKFGERALWMCHLWGDFILEPLREVSSDFASLDSRNSIWVGDVLTRNASPRSVALAAELHQRDELLAKLVGSIGLAAHGRLSESEFRAGGVLHSILTDEQHLYLSLSDGGRAFADTTPVELALIAAKHARSRDSVPAILALIEKRPLDYWVHSQAADALSAIGDPRAVPVLQGAMRSPDFYALPHAFRALVELQDPQAIPLAIARIDPEMEENDTFLMRELEAVTRQRFGFDQARWRDWWEMQRKPRSSILPAGSIRPLSHHVCVASLPGTARKVGRF